MAGEHRPWYKRPLAVFALFVAVVLGAWFLAFVWNVGRDIFLIQTGQLDPVAALKSRNFQASVSRAIANSNVTSQDIVKIEEGSNPTLGNPAAKLHIVEFLDYGCPYCKQAAPVIREFMAKHPADAFFVVRDFPIVELHPSAMNDAIAARCVFSQGDVNRYWLYYDRLFASQDAQSPADLRTYAEQIGVDLGAFDTCVRTNQPKNDIQASLQDGLAAGAQGTPTFFFNGLKIQGAVDAASLEVIAKQVRDHSSMQP